MTSNPVKEEAAMTLDKQAVERGAKVLFAVTADQINRDPNGYDQLPEYSKEQVRTATRAVLETATIAALVPQEEEVGRMELLELLELGGDYAAEVFNDFADKEGECALRVAANIERFDKAHAMLERLVGIQGK